jgi:multidrug resistance efflux pump
MSIPTKIWATVRLPWRVLRACQAGAGRLARSARFWVLLLLAVIGGLVAYYALANRETPFTTDAYVQAYVIQVAPRVEGQVVRVGVRENQLVPKGTLLFELDPRPYEHKVRQLEASLAQAIQQVAQMNSELAAARAEEARVTADADYALAVHDQESLIFKQDATTKRRYLDAVQKHKAAQALRDKARAVVRQREQALQAKIGDEHALVAEVKAQLASARLNLEWTRVYAPTNGYVTNLQLRVGSYVPAGRPVLTCIDADQWWVVANFRESNLERLREGQPVRIAFKQYPGRLFSGKVRSVGWGVGQGQGVPSGELPVIKGPSELIPLAQRFQVRVTLDHPGEVALRVGATASVIVYTRADSPLNPVGEFWQEIDTQLNYVR